MPLSYDPDFAKAAGPMVAAMAAALKTPRHDIAALRSSITAMIAPVKNLPGAPDIDVNLHEVLSSDGHKIPVYHIASKDNARPSRGPAILAQDWTNVRALQVQQTGIPIFTVDYRLAPEHPFPTPIQDIYTALAWIHERTESFGVDRSRITVMGESAGGGLAAGVALMARDRGLSPPLAKQIILFPMLDDRTASPNPELEKLVTWNTDNNITGWSAYLGQDKVGRDDAIVSPYAAPARATQVEGLPPLFVDVGGLDILRDECIAYASKAAAANVPVELHVYPGVTHGFEALAVGTDVANRALANRHAAMRSF
ncbi:hypothetical protein BDV06DRAFT_233760 [Aspergillus oleicola]